MKFFKQLKSIILPRQDVPLVKSNFTKAVFVIEPTERLTLDYPVPTRISLVGFAGVLWITVQGHLTDYVLRQGEETSIEVLGLVVVESMTSHVPGRIEIIHSDRDRNKSPEIASCA